MADEKPAAEAKKRKLIKGRHASAIKRHRQSVTRAVRNKSTLSTLRTSIKRVIQAVRDKDSGQAKTALRNTVSLLHKAAGKNVIHQGNASRHIARLSSLVAKIG